MPMEASPPEGRPPASPATEALHCTQAVALTPKVQCVTNVWNGRQASGNAHLSLFKEPEDYQSDEGSEAEAMEQDSDDETRGAVNCQGNISCNDERHAVGEIRIRIRDSLKREKHIHLLAHILVILLSARVSASTYACFECNPPVTASYHALLSHMKRAHGWLFGCRFDGVETNERIHQQRTKMLHKGKSPNLICAVCLIPLTSHFHGLFHIFSVHPENLDGPSFCVDCLIPLVDTTFVRHWNDRHQAACGFCPFASQSLNAYMTHLVRFHFVSLSHALDGATLTSLYLNARHHTTLVPWTNLSYILTDTMYVNPLFPPLHSPEFFTIMRMVVPQDSPLYKFAVPYNDYEFSKHRISGGDGSRIPHRESIRLETYNEFQTKITKSLARMTSRLKMSFFSVFTTEVAELEENPCQFCDLDIPHNSNRADCQLHFQTVSRLRDLLDYRMTGEEFRSYPFILIGRTSYSHIPTDCSFPILNLTPLSRYHRYATGFEEGRPVVLVKRGNHKKADRGLFKLIEQVIAARLGWGKSSTVLFMVEFFLVNPVALEDRESIFCQILAFLSEIRRLKDEYNVEILVLPPFRKHNRGGTASDYQASIAYSSVVGNMLTAMCMKLHVAVAPHHGHIGCFGYQPLDNAPYTLPNGNGCEPLFTLGGYPTKEYLRRLGNYFTEIGRAWIATIKLLPHLREQYQFDLANGGYKIPAELLPLTARPREPAPDEDTVD